MLRPPRAALVALLAGCLLPAGCGDGGQPQTTAQAPPERFDRRPPLPAGWKRLVNPRAGFSIGLPPGWRGTAAGTTVLRAPGAAATAAIGADRSVDGEATGGLEAYAASAVRSLQGYRGLRAGRPTRLRGARYETVIVRARGTYAATRVPQAITLAAIRRPGRVTFTVFFFRDTRLPGGPRPALFLRMIRSFSAQPPQF